MPNVSSKKVSLNRAPKAGWTPPSLLVVGTGNEGARLRAGLVERLRGLDVDRRADGARGEGEVGSLVNVELADVFGAQGAEVEVLAVAGSDWPAVRKASR